MRYSQQREQDRASQQFDNYERYRNYDDIEDVDYEHSGRDRYDGRGGMGRSYNLRGERDMRDSAEGYADFGDDEVGYSEGRKTGTGYRSLAANYTDDRRETLRRHSRRHDDNVGMRSTGDRRASHDPQFDRDSIRHGGFGRGRQHSPDRDSAPYPSRRPEHDYDHSQERYSSSHGRPHPSRNPRY